MAEKKRIDNNPLLFGWVVGKPFRATPK